MQAGARLGYAAFAAASLIWGSTFLVIRLGNETVPPLWASTIRLVLAAVLLTAIALVVGQRFPRGAALYGALGYGFFQFGLNFGLLYWGEQTVPSGIAAVFYATIPLTTLLVASAIGLERLRVATLAGALLAFGGVAAIFAGELSKAVPLEGLVAVFAAATSAAISGVILKRAPVQDAIPANAVGAAVGAVVCLAASFGLGESQALPASFDAWWPILYLTILGSLGAFVLWTWLLKTWKASSASMITVVVPVLAVLLGAFANAERPSAAAFVGAVLVLGGVVVVLRLPSHAPKVPAEAAPAARR